MKRNLFTLLALLAVIPVFGGGMQHNTNQSAQWVRTLSRDATTELDAVFFNPAGLTKLPDGFHIAINNQTAFQTRIITCTNPTFNNPEFKGETFVLVLPTLFAAYKKGKLAISGGVVVIGGGGSAIFEKGVPSFEKDIASIPVGLSAQGIPTSGYSTEMNVKGSQGFFGVQLGASYAVNDMISLFVGGRYILAPESFNYYEGYIKNIQINPNYPAFGASYNGSFVSATKFFTDAAATMGLLATGATTASQGLQALIAGGMPATTPLTSLPASTQAQIAQILGAAKISTTGMNVGTAAATLTALAPGFTANGATMTGYANATKDQELGTKQSGSGFTPIFGMNLSFMEDKLNIGLKYEHSTELKLKNNTRVDPSGLFPNGAEKNNDFPAWISAGLSFKASDNLEVSCGYHRYFDKKVKYYNNDKANEDYLDGDATEFALGLQYGLSDKLIVSGGYLFAKTQKKAKYQSDLSYSLPSSTIGVGGQYNLSDKFNVNLGISRTFYQDKQNEAKDTFGKSAMLIAVGLGFSFMQ